MLLVILSLVKVSHVIASLLSFVLCTNNVCEVADHTAIYISLYQVLLTTTITRGKFRIIFK